MRHLCVFSLPVPVTPPGHGAVIFPFKLVSFLVQERQTSPLSYCKAPKPRGVSRCPPPNPRQLQQHMFPVACTVGAQGASITRSQLDCRQKAISRACRAVAVRCTDRKRRRTLGTATVPAGGMIATSVANFTGFRTQSRVHCRTLSGWRRIRSIFVATYTYM